MVVLRVSFSGKVFEHCTSLSVLGECPRHLLCVVWNCCVTFCPWLCCISVNLSMIMGLVGYEEPETHFDLYTSRIWRSVPKSSELLRVSDSRFRCCDIDLTEQDGASGDASELLLGDNGFDSLPRHEHWWSISWYSLVCPAEYLDYTSHSAATRLPHPFQFIIHRQSCHSTAFNRSYWECRTQHSI